MNRFRVFICTVVLWSLVALMVTPYTVAGTYRNDFKVEDRFNKDKTDGVWKLDVDSFIWQNGAIRGSGVSKLLMFGEITWTDYSLTVRVKPEANAEGGIGLRYDNGPHYVFWFDEPANQVGIFAAGAGGTLVENSFNLKVVPNVIGIEHADGTVSTVIREIAIQCLVQDIHRNFPQRNAGFSHTNKDEIQFIFCLGVEVFSPGFSR